MSGSRFLSGSWTPIFFFPQEGGEHRRPGAKKRNSVVLCLFFAILALPNCILNFASKKHRKKCENEGFWPPKTLPKWIQNAFKIDVPKNMRFCIDFSSKKLLPQERRHRFRIGFSNTFCLSDTFLQIAFGMPFGFEKPTKTFPKQGPNPSKNDAENMMFFNIVFFASWRRFWKVLGLQLGAKLAQNASADGKVAYFLGFLN